MEYIEREESDGEYDEVSTVLYKDFLNSAVCLTVEKLALAIVHSFVFWNSLEGKRKNFVKPTARRPQKKVNRK